MNPSNKHKLIQRYGPMAIVTGASSGIGKALAIELAEAGFDLLLVARRKNSLETFADELIAKHGRIRRFNVLIADLGTTDGVNAIIREADDHDIGLLVAAAGFGTAGTFTASNLETEINLLEVNCLAPLILAHHFGERFAQRSGGGIIFFGSLVGFQGAPRAAHYAATKAYIQTLAEGLHHELKERRVDVLACAPGPVRSGFADRSDMRMGFADRPETVAKNILAALGHRMTTTPGPLSKFLTASLMTAPRFLRVRIMGKIMGGMTSHLP